VSSWATLAGACAGGSAAGTPDAGGGGRSCVPGSPFDVSGRAGVRGVPTVPVNASGLVGTDTTAALILPIDLEQSGADVGVSAVVCELRIPEVPISGQDQPLRFELAPGLLDSVARVTGTATVDGTTTCAEFSSAPITVLIGARMTPPEAGMMPEANAAGEYTECLPAGSPCSTAITSQCACDQENDDKPGATLLAMNVPAISISEVYVDLRTTFTLVGKVFSSDEIEGEITATLEQGILGCAKAAGAACSASEVGAVKKLNPDISQNAEPSIFRAVRVDDALDCAALVAQRDTLFPR